MKQLTARSGKKPLHMKCVSVQLPESYVDGLHELVRKNMYISRSAVIRSAIRDLLRKELWSKKK